MEQPRFCPKCRSRQPMVRAGFSYRRSGRKQQWKCRSKKCGSITVHPTMSKK